MKEIRFILREEFLHEQDETRRDAFRRSLEALSAQAPDETCDGEP